MIMLYYVNDYYGILFLFAMKDTGLTDLLPDRDDERKLFDRPHFYMGENEI